MSTTDLYVVASDGDVLHAASFRNAHGGAMAVWGLLGRRYFSDGLGEFNFLTFMREGMRPLFQSARKGNMEPWEAVTLMTTCDNVIIPIEHVTSVASAFESFVEHYGPIQQEKQQAFSIGEQAVELRRLAAEAPTKGWRGVCWNQTSVNGDCLWEGGEDEDEEWRSYNVDRDVGHWYWPS